MTWTYEKDALLRKMWVDINPLTGEKYTMLSIGESLGISRSAVAGRINRLGLVRNRKVHPPRVDIVKNPNKYARELPPETGRSKRFDQLKNQCQYEMSGSKRSLNRYCGKKCTGHRAFCDYHYDICYVSMPKKIYVPTEKENSRIEQYKAWLD